ncbi:hypothetical protein [Roseateles toxinivorans]|nr:hypothetical protein [Roseateles toxinivorans]
MQRFPLSPAAALLAVVLFFASSAARAGEGHDHGEAPAAAAGPALPRFTASSELFELVGVLQGTQLTLYLDHADSNAPVKNAKLELEFGPRKLTPKPHGDGEFTLTLDAEPQPGALAVMATVTTASDSDLLAGELDIHEAAHAEEAHVHSAKEWAIWTGSALAALIAVGLLARRLIGARALRTGAAA